MVISLSITFISLAAIGVMLQAEFIAVVQVLIYAGAITILMIFGIMMTNHKEIDQRNVQAATPCTRHNRRRGALCHDLLRGAASCVPASGR